MNNKRNRIPTISNDRIDTTVSIIEKSMTAEDIRINNILKGKNSIQSLTIRIPKNIYKVFREIAFKKDIKMNQIIISFIENYIEDEK